MEYFLFSLNSFFLNQINFFILFTFLNFLFYFFHGLNSNFEGINTDQEKQIKISEDYFKWWPWPSNIHNFTDKAAMKDVGVLILTLFIRIFNIKNKYALIVLISNLAHLFSFFLIYLIVEKFFNSQVAIFVSVIYYFSIWPYLIILHAGFQILGQLFFLLSIYILMFVNFLTIDSLYLSFLSGFFFTVSNFSSASSRKYIPLYFIFVSYHFFHFDNFISYNYDYFINLKFIIFCFFLLLLIFHLLIILFKSFFAKLSINILYNLKIIKYNDIEKKNTYFKKINNLIFYSSVPLLILNLFIIFNIFFLESFYALYCFTVLIIAMLIVILLFTYPNFKKSISSFFYYWTIENLSGSHFPFYSEYFLKKYNTIFNKNYKWHKLILLIYFRIMTSLIFLIFFLIILFLFQYENYQINYFHIFFIFVLTFSPLIWSEITGGPKAVLPLYNTFIAFFTPLAILMNLLYLNDPQLITKIFYLVLFIYILFNVFLFYVDLYPSRIHVYKIKKYIDYYNINKLYSYDNDYAKDTIKILSKELKNKVDIIYIKSITEIDNGIFLQPSINNKSAFFQSSKIGYSIEDFNYDPHLLKLYDNNIEAFTIIKFKNRSTSRLWQLTGNVAAFRDIVLKEITKDDIVKSYVRLIKINKKFLKDSKII